MGFAGDRIIWKLFVDWSFFWVGRSGVSIGFLEENGPMPMELEETQVISTYVFS